ncbi:MAG TPA: PQQ-dependent sugar dehydrogenase, partial [Actinomycetota bacterium]|nr:PQQ-dependent sugar dehydrogenase [Actinomycetota bacterium]
MRRMGSLAVLAALTVAALGGTAAVPAVAAGVKAVRVATGLDSPVGFTFTPAGRLVYLERNTGWLRFRDLGTGADQRIFRITNVNFDGERGALGVAVDPRWPDRRFVYVYVTRNTSKGLRNQILRIKVENGKKVGLRTLLSVSAGPASNHNGGRIAFGPDGKLYVVIGDNAVPSNAQDRSANLHGKILRINPDGSVPSGNPFGTRIWAYGIRNSIGFTWDRGTGRLWETENGPECNDEVNLIRKGRNYGWGPNQDCS